MNLNNYFDPVGKNFSSEIKKERLFGKLELHDQNNTIENIENYDMAFFCVEVQDDILYEQKIAFDRVRAYLYSLRTFDRNIRIIDLGNFKRGQTKRDTIIGLRDVLVDLLTHNVLPIVIGDQGLLIEA